MERDPERIPDKKQLLRFLDPRFLEIFDECVKTPDGQMVAASAPQDLLRIVEDAWYFELVLDLACGIDRRPLAEPVSATKPIGSKRWRYADHLEFVAAVETARESKGSLKEAFAAVQRLEKIRHFTELEPRYYESKKFIVIISWALSATLLWFTWRIIRANANTPTWTAICVASLCVGPDNTKNDIAGESEITLLQNLAREPPCSGAPMIAEMTKVRASINAGSIMVISKRSVPIFFQKHRRIKL